MTGWEWSLRTRQARCIAVAAVLVGVTLWPGGLAAQQMSAAEVATLKSQVEATGGRVIVQVKPNQGPRLQANGRSAMSDQVLATVQSRLQQQGLRNVWRLNLVPLVMGEVGLTDGDLEALLAHPNVVSVEPDVDMPLAEWRAPSFREVALASFNQSTPWGIDRVTGPAAWALRSPALDGHGIKVAYLDSGGDINHPDLRFAGGYDATSGSTSASAWHDDLTVCDGHGTHVAGTIGALNNGVGVVGVAPGVSLYAIKVFRNASGSCLASVSHQIGGLNWAVSQGVRVVSVSIGGTTSVSAYEQAVNAAVSAGTLVVAAAGNNGTSAVTFPGRYTNALAIGGTDTDNNMPSWSNFGPDLFAVAPGVSIYSTMPGGGYAYKSGSSMAAPHAAGVVALVLAADPGASPSQVLSRLQQGALDLGGAGRDDQYGHGLIRAFESIHGAVTPPPPPSPVPLSLSLTPTSRSAPAAEGSSVVIADSGTVSLSGDGSGSTIWTASKRKAWTLLTTGSGTGSGTIRWTRTTAGLVAGIYVDTITVMSAGAIGSPTAIIDTLVVTALPGNGNTGNGSGNARTRPKGGRKTVVSHSTAQAPGIVFDSIEVYLDQVDAPAFTWSATSDVPWLHLLRSSGSGDQAVSWSRDAASLADGLHVGQITVRLQVEGAEYALAFADSVLTGVEDPGVTRAAEALFDSSPLTDPQRRLLDQLGNRNGSYDIGDFLAWVERAGSAPSAVIMDRVMQWRPTGSLAEPQRPDELDN